MSLEKTLNQQVDEYMLNNPKKQDEVGYYNRIASKFNIHPEKARKRWRMLQTKENQSVNFVHVEGLPEKQYDYYYAPTSKVVKEDSAQFQFNTDKQIDSLEDLVEVSDIDTKKFDVTGYEVKSYNAWIKNKAGVIERKPMFSVKATTKIKRTETTQDQKNVILEEIKRYSPKPQFVPKNQPIDGRDTALEINIPDLHIGKLAWGKETGGTDYDIKIAVERYKTAVFELLSRVNVDTVERFILPVGNDMINVDNKGNTTTAGTSVSCDSRFGKMFQTAKELLIDTIEMLAHVAPVDVIIVPGNHDTVAMFTLGEVLDAWFHNHDFVNVINTHTPRKYYQYGENLIMYTHGHNEKLNDLGIICATEQPKLWAATKFRRVHVGHFHHSKQLKFMDVQEYPGFTVKVLNSLSSNDAWHSEKGYNSLKGAEAFLYHKNKGLLANYYYLTQA